jgi:hypothetical protein
MLGMTHRGLDYAEPGNVVDQICLVTTCGAELFLKNIGQEVITDLFSQTLFLKCRVATLKRGRKRFGQWGTAVAK